ncbi:MULTISPECIES: BMC domain-containing protein [unclassified Streptococcus]|uniref:BMC domain-containing protein n=1 Tax=unclassified Streptococcus TaxID=2608887 RepID=UPI001072406A|nr:MULTISPECIES: BMC domain-containing protein [unclassified Streptococcus]MBF0786423.1 BMC domain-containing protein [Streptococcus sp. 19428wC2_LYSM12]MCQ9212530.1 BMC domain-containing protein [Streptococcus sp. B01]MCQ9213869.1 BMC domain-containing protein [Streptococcus sp. O1]TFV06831.1 BMC domain-containing protein [Streptococcus sp. LYSM12]
MEALGMVETYGLIGGVEAADVMLKLAAIPLGKTEKVRGGLVNVSITGDIGAVKTAVEAGASTVKGLGDTYCYCSHVIPRPDNQVIPLYKEDEDIKQKGAKTTAELEEVVQECQPVFLETPVEIEPGEIHLTSNEYRKRLEKTEELVQGMVRRKMVAVLMEEFEKRGKN